MLPVELLLAIVQHVDPMGESDQRQVLRTLRATSTVFHALATPRLFSCIYVTNTDSSAHALACILNDPVLTGHAKELVYEDKELRHAHMGSVDATAEDEDAQERTRIALVSAISHLHKATALTALTFIFYPHAYEDPSFAEGALSASPITRLYCTFLRAIATLPAAPPRVTSLTLRNVRPIHIPELGAPGGAFTALLTQLGALHLHICDAPFVPEVIWTFWRTGVRDVLLGAAPQRAPLTALALHCSHHSYMYFTGFGLARMHFPRLRALALSNMYFSSPFLRLEEFILRHAPTLRRLELRSCALLLHPGGLPPARSWAEIYGGFASELGELEELEITHSKHIMDPGNHQAALAALSAVVDARKAQRLLESGQTTVTWGV
ncbi:hypothetical protein DENSPDRAFT_929791 [Dentipellis sp. KUC8613]|nr:hypothetical protein DENSPDRAFT_929791 [Dentipellis sp. KUC8613]